MVNETVGFLYFVHNLEIHKLRSPKCTGPGALCTADKRRDEKLGGGESPPPSARATWEHKRGGESTEGVEIPCRAVKGSQGHLSDQEDRTKSSSQDITTGDP